MRWLPSAVEYLSARGRISMLPMISILEGDRRNSFLKSMPSWRIYLQTCARHANPWPRAQLQYPGQLHNSRLRRSCDKRGWAARGDRRRSRTLGLWLRPRRTSSRRSRLPLTNADDAISDPGTAIIGSKITPCASAKPPHGLPNSALSAYRQNALPFFAVSPTSDVLTTIVSQGPDALSARRRARSASSRSSIA
jgi:hypothetical protein